MAKPAFIKNTKEPAINIQRLATKSRVELFKSCAVTLPTPINSMTIREKQKDRILRKRGRYSRKDNNRFIGYNSHGQFPLYSN
ncbi:hypothetical protein C789_5064 [Microcystis aeruginosa FACHB-905 = DIANCHI905]|nr:hypothetical protein C789_5064 [Microcystis aeruginosa FACHB-905 = DIANCHI905]